MRFVFLTLATLAASVASAQAPDIDVTAGTLDAELAVGATTSRAILIANAGDAPLDYRVRTDGESGGAVVYAYDNYTNTLYGVDPETGAVLSEVPTSVGGRPVFDGGSLYLLSGNTLYTLDPTTGRTLASVTLSTGGGYYYVRDAAASDGQVAVAVHVDGASRIDLFDPASGALVRSVALDFQPIAVAVGEGVFYVTGSDPEAGRVLATIDALSGERTRTRAFAEVQSLTFSRSLGALLTLADTNDPTVRVYDPETTDFLSSFDLPTTPGGYVFYEGIGADEGTEVPWLLASPRSGTVAAGGQVGVTLTVDAGRVVGGTYTADVLLLSNDPDEPEIALPITLVAVGVPAVEVAPDSLGFGTVYVGTPSSRSFTVSNPGSDTLRVSAVSGSDDRLAVSVDAFEVLPGDSLAVEVTLTPTGAGALDVTVTLTTNVEDAPSVVVPVTGMDVFPPVLAVSPSSLAVEGLAGETTTATLTIANDGQGPLTYGVAAGLTAEVLPARPRAANAVAPEAASANPQREARREAGRPGAGVDAPRLLPIVSDADANPVVDLVGVRGAVGPDSLYLAFDYAEFPDYVQINVDLDLDTDPTSGSNYYSPLGVDGRIEVFVSYDDYQGRYYGDVIAFENGASRNYYGDSFQLVGESVVIAVPLSELPSLGRAFDLTVRTNGEFYQDGGYRRGTDEAPNEGIIAVQSAPWLEVGVDDVAGEVSPGESVDVTLSFDATDLLGGVYDGLVVVEGNGPVPQVADVPVVFDVTGVPVASAAPLAFGDVFVGFETTGTIVIENTGTGTLVVEHDDAPAPVVRAQAGPFEIPPGGSEATWVVIQPTEAGRFESTVGFTTNEEGGTLGVVLSGNALPAPVAGASVASVSEEVPRDVEQEVSLSLTNTGGSPLTYRAQVAPAPQTAALEAVPASEELAAARDLQAAVRSEALRRVGPVRAASRAERPTLPTVLVDPDEGLPYDVLEVRAGWIDGGEHLAFEIVLPSDYSLQNAGGLVYLDTDQDPSTGGSTAYALRDRDFGADLEIQLFNFGQGEAYAARLSSPFTAQYIPLNIANRALSFEIPVSLLLEERAFDLVGLMDGYLGGDVFPNTGVATIDPVSWLTLSSREGTVAVGESADLGLRIDTETLSVGTHRAVVMISTNDPAMPVLEVPVTVDVVVNTPVEEAAVPTAFALRPPAPNPTRASARLLYALPEAVEVRAEVFDAVGRRVMALDEGARSAGTHVLDLSAASLPSGVYTVRLRAGSDVGVQQLSVVR